MQRKKNKYQVFRLRGDDYELPGRERGEKRVINEGKISGKINLNLRDVYPLRIYKQILSMFCSSNGVKFTENHLEIRNFILEKESRLHLPVKIYAYLNIGILYKKTGVVGIAELKKRVVGVYSEISFIPFGFVMEIRSLGKMKSTNIDFFKEFKYDDKTDIDLKLPLLESNSYLPLDYRSKEEIFKTIEKYNNKVSP